MDFSDVLLLSRLQEPSRASVLVSKLAEHGVNYSACVSLEKATNDFAESLKKNDIVIISTGFPILKAKAAFENDGPIGAVLLASLLESVDISTVFVVEKRLSRAMQQLCERSGVRFPIVVSISPEERRFPDILRGAKHPIVFIEKPGRSIGGKYLNMFGKDVSDYIYYPELLEAVVEPELRLSLGDGGNEHGSLTLVGGDIELGKKVGLQAFTTVDHFLLAGTSNLAATALTISLSKQLNTDWQYSLEYERSLFEHAKEVNLVDGKYGWINMSVDGISWDEYSRHLQVLAALLDKKG